MQPGLAFLHCHTPKLTVIESRGLAVRSLDYHRAVEGQDAEARVNRMVYDPVGRVIELWDPRLFLNASAPANLSTVHSLSGTALCTVSVDSGWHVGLFADAGQAVHSWDGRGSQCWMHYDNQVRLTALFEQGAQGGATCAERLTYASHEPASADHNQCGQLIRHDDPAGTRLFPEFGLAGGLLEQTWHFLRTLTSPDWPELVTDRDQLLEPGGGVTSHSRFNALGEAIEQSDAKGNRQFFSQTLAGQLRDVRLQLQKDAAPTTLVSAIQYNAHGQTERELAGNGVITELEYGPEDGRLTRLYARRGKEVLQGLRYDYDPLGNVLRIEDAALSVRYFANQRIDPVNQYVYDSLYQLISATGWEAGSTNKGPPFSTFDDPAPLGNYRQTFHYDRGGNLLELIHEGPQNHGHRLVAESFSNRCLPVVEDVEPGEGEFRTTFDRNGNLLKLQPGQTLTWDLRNQLREVRPVERGSATADSERYIYGADGMRVRKVRSMQTNARIVTSEVRYLPDLEIRTHSGTDEELHEIIVKAGRSSVRVLHWESPPPAKAANDRYRYNVNDHLGSCALELDSDAKVISQEWYHAFGTTARFAGRAEVEASYKTVRYSGKERDATGLYYYGFRYYVSWLQRWVNPDPAADVDGMNFYSMVGNSPLNQRDDNGLVGTDVTDKAYFKSRGISNVRGIEDYKIKHPKIADNVVKGIAGAIESLELSIAKLQSKDDHHDVAAVLQDYLGDSTDSRIDLYKASEELANIFERARDGLLQHQSDNYKNILLVDNSTNDVFFTYPGDARIYMTFRANDRANGFTYARVFAHEITHSLEISNDIWAVNHKVLRLAVLGDKSDQDDERAASAKIALNPKLGSMFDAETFMVSVDGWFSFIKILFQGRDGALESSLRKFKENESIRRKVIFSNAASLESMMHALTAREVHRRLLPFVPLG